MRYTHFSKTERLELSILLKKGYSIRAIARALERDPSSVSRELQHNKVNGIYNPRKAHHKAYVRRKYSKYQAMKIVGNSWLEEYIKKGLEAEWTPEEIAGRLAEEQGHRVVSFKTIYKWLYSSYGAAWSRYLLSRRDHRKKRKSRKAKKILIPQRVFIDERPRIIEERTRLGDFEADLLGVPRWTQKTLAAVVDRASLYFQAIKIPRQKYAIEGYAAILADVRVASLTLDNDVAHVRYRELGVETYFCHPYRSWEKPIIENTFQRLRRWIPKRANLADYSNEDIAAIVDRMNNTPRKRLGYRTPYEVFNNIPLPVSHCGCCA